MKAAIEVLDELKEMLDEEFGAVLPDEILFKIKEIESLIKNTKGLVESTAPVKQFPLPLGLYFPSTIGSSYENLGLIIIALTNSGYDEIAAALNTYVYKAAQKPRT